MLTMTPPTNNRPSLFDAHCHLTDRRLAHCLPEILEKARLAGVHSFISCSTSPADWQQVRNLSETYPQVIPAFGIHPWFLRDLPANWEAHLRDMLLANPRALIGEAGLDHLHNRKDDALEASVLQRQLQLANELNRPVILHCMRAWQPLINLLEETAPHPAPIMLHSYSGSVELIEQLIPHDVYFSFSGAVTNPKSTRIHAAVRAVPADRLLIETDAPDFLPHDITNRDQPNQPANLPRILRAMASLRNAPLHEITACTTRNARKFCQW
jgi:TatD DNase family protein